jgi:hypothetical protein
VDECGIARFQRLVEMREGGGEIAYRSGQHCTLHSDSAGFD